ncbi:LAME_0B03356g1_1 [Lachancea meyersii CBS 8951]|uniref:GPI mannosyltransferase 2 n=1 Tax=Lachancea meyersii CBS 8951 TaxID=1266667 RepID=A0A1G4IUQ8_9SACH|nr:LAME_0B03356g1_1 [Lachancea meyersii CBS 8951]
MSIFKIACFFAAVKCVLYLIVFLAPAIQFDTSTNLFLERFASEEDINIWWNVRLWNKLVSWDAVFFLKNAMRHDSRPEYEHENAFSLLWCDLIRKACRGDLSFYHVLKMAVILENCLHLGATIVLYFVTLRTFRANAFRLHHRHLLAQKTAMLFVAGSASGFFLGVYSEPLSALLTFSGMLCREYATGYDVRGALVIPWTKWPIYTILSTFCFAAAFAVRPNCVLLGLYYVFDLWNLLKSKNYRKATFMPLLSGLGMFCFLVYYQYYAPYQYYCPERGEWCAKKIWNLPVSYESLYSFIQSRYWNVGLLHYWTLNNIPNFIIALPNAIILWFSAIYFSHQYPCPNLRPLVLIVRVFLVVMVFFAHVQIINRVASFLPLHLWYIADRHNKLKFTKDENMKGDDKLVRFYVIWLVFWLPLQTSLFASFLPPA